MELLFSPAFGIYSFMSTALCAAKGFYYVGGSSAVRERLIFLSSLSPSYSKTISPFRLRKACLGHFLDAGGFFSYGFLGLYWMSIVDFLFLLKGGDINEIIWWDLLGFSRLLLVLEQLFQPLFVDNKCGILLFWQTTLDFGIVNILVVLRSLLLV